ncbi:MAG: DUF4402 domain-containing protein [Candidatus Neomarinimicrobiota bacterium]
MNSHIKNNKIALIVALLSINTLVFAQAVNQTANVSAVVLEPLALSVFDAVDFGNIQVGSTPVLNPVTGAGTDVGTVNSIAYFTLTGSNGAAVSVSYDATVTLGDGGSNTMTFTPNLVGHATTQSSATAIANGSNTTTLGASGFTFWLGGTLGTLTGQATGTYSSSASNGSGDFTLTIEYY